MAWICGTCICQECIQHYIVIPRPEERLSDTWILIEMSAIFSFDNRLDLTGKKHIITAWKTIGYIFVFKQTLEKVFRPVWWKWKQLRQFPAHSTIQDALLHFVGVFIHLECFRPCSHCGNSKKIVIIADSKCWKDQNESNWSSLQLNV